MIRVADEPGAYDHVRLDLGRLTVARDGLVVGVVRG